MAKWKCQACEFIYNEEDGLPDQGILPGTKFKELPDDWVCPLCGVGKEFFEKLEG